jgi:RNA polymerase sigma-70 factor (ECF subfamily)
LAFLKNISSGQSDDALVQAYQQNGDVAHVAELYQRYMELVYGVCLKYLQAPEDAQDSTMMVYSELCEKLLKHEVANFKSWLYTLAKNHCLMRLRSQKGKKMVLIDPALMQSEETVHLDGVFQKEAHLQQMEYCLEQLSTQQKTVIELFYLQGKCYNEIAQQTGLEWKEVRSYIQNGRRNLKICMDQQIKKGAFSS